MVAASTVVSLSSTPVLNCSMSTRIGRLLVHHAARGVDTLAVRLLGAGGEFRLAVSAAGAARQQGTDERTIESDELAKAMRV